jgi:hypothetical protein
VGLCPTSGLPDKSQILLISLLAKIKLLSVTKSRCGVLKREVKMQWNKVLLLLSKALPNNSVFPKSLKQV